MKSHSVPVLLAALLVALAVLAAWRFLGARRDETPPLEIPVVSTTPRAGTAPTALAPVAPPTSEAPAPAPRSELAAEAERAGLVRVAVEVFREDDGRPVPGADVYGFGSEQLTDPRTRDELDQVGLGLEFLARNGQHVRTDAGGIAHLPLAVGTLQVVASDGERFGMRTLERWSVADGTIRVGLRAAPGIEVLVRDAGTGAPLAEIAVIAERSAAQDAPIGAHTGADGRARLWPLFEEPDSPGRWHARVPGVFREEVRASFTLADAPALLELALPPSASVDVRLVDPAGRLCPLPGSLVVGWNDREGDPVRPIEVRITDGLARLGPVELGVKVHLRAVRLATGENPELAFTLEARDGPRKRIDLMLPRAVPLLYVRLLDEAGEPLRFVRVEASCASWSDGLVDVVRSGSVSRDDGRAQFVLPAPERPLALGTFVFEAEAAGGTRLGGVFHAPVQADVTELGDAVLGPPLPLFAGRVIDEQGEPVAGVDVRLEWRPGEGRSVVARCLPGSTDAQGRFELRGWGEDGEFELTVFHAGSRARARARRGADGVELRLE